MNWPRDASLQKSRPQATPTRRPSWRVAVAACLTACAAFSAGVSATAADEGRNGEKLIGTFKISPGQDEVGATGRDVRNSERSSPGVRAVVPGRPAATAQRRNFLTGSAAVPYAVEDIFLREAGDRVFFGSGSAEIGTRARTVIVQQADWLKRNLQFRLTIEGHADDGGTAEENTRISLERAVALRERLIDEGIDARRIAVVSRGREDRIAACADPACTAQNRRAVVVVHANGAGERVGLDRARGSGAAPPRPGDASGRLRVPVPQ